MGYNTVKKAMRRVFTLSLFLFLFSSHLVSYAQVDKRNVSVDNSFFKLCADNNVKFRLRSYGLYENGKEVNKFYTKDNENEYIQFANSYFYRTISSVGDFRYSYTISGNKIVFTNEEKRNSYNNLWTTINSNPQSWIKIQKAEIIDNGISVTLRIMSIDNNNTYRYYFIVEETPITLQGQIIPSESSKKSNNTGVNNSSYNYNNSYNNSYNYNNSNQNNSSSSTGDRLVGNFQAFGIGDGITGGTVTHSSSFPVYQYSNGGYYVKSGWKMSTLSSNGKSSHRGYSVSQYNYFAVIDGVIWYFKIY